MIHHVTGNLLTADVEAHVNAVNCVGVMGKGIALQFRQAYPDDYFQAFRHACQSGDVAPGKVHVWETGHLVNPRFIINFPTKRDWREKSKLDDIDTGLLSLNAAILEYGIHGIAIPPLGCGHGGLDWPVVKALIERRLRGIKGVEIHVFEPAGTSASNAMSGNTK